MFGCFLLAAINTLLIFSVVIGTRALNVKSMSETSPTGTRMATALTNPSSSGIILPTNRAAPVVVGMILSAAARERRTSPEFSTSSNTWVFVYA